MLVSLHHLLLPGHGALVVSTFISDRHSFKFSFCHSTVISAVGDSPSPSLSFLIREEKKCFCRIAVRVSDKVP